MVTNQSLQVNQYNDYATAEMSDVDRLKHFRGMENVKRSAVAVNRSFDLDP